MKNDELWLKSIEICCFRRCLFPAEWKKKSWGGPHKASRHCSPSQCLRLGRKDHQGRHQQQGVALGVCLGLEEEERHTRQLVAQAEGAEADHRHEGGRRLAFRGGAASADQEGRLGWWFMSVSVEKSIM